MNYEVVNLQQKVVVGVTARTGNADPECQKIIGGLWQSFMGNGIAETVKDRANDYCIGLYSNYDFATMTYDVTVGVEVKSFETSTEIKSCVELSTKIIPEGKYAKFRVKGDVVIDVANAWEEIWKMPLERTFTGDFEEYVSNLDGVAEINIYIALK